MGSGYVREDHFMEAHDLVQSVVDHWRAGRITTPDDVARPTLERAQVFLVSEQPLSPRSQAQKAPTKENSFSLIISTITRLT